jgi:hypothetical protein
MIRRWMARVAVVTMVTAAAFLGPADSAGEPQAASPISVWER